MSARRFAFLLLVAGLLLAAPATAPALELDSVATPLPSDVHTSCYRKLFCFHTAEQRDGVDAWVEALTATEITFTMRTHRTNLDGPLRTGPLVLDRPGRIHLAQLRRVQRGGWKYYFKYTYHPGRPDTARPDPNAVYHLPFPPRRSYRVSQGQKTTNTHKNYEAYAVDWNFKVGDPVHAMRGGQVVGAGGWSGSRKRGRGNFIWIRHADGTYGWYLHLKTDGVLVKAGDTVKTGQLIGYSGNTGKSSGPHLHFQLSVPTSGRYAFRTIPFRLQTTEGVVTTIKTGDRHRRP